MRITPSRSRVHLLFATTLVTTSAAIAADRTESGQTLVVPDDHAALGTVYYVHAGKDAQMTFTSDAPLEHIKGTSNQAIGYAIAPENGASVAALLKGEFRIPIDSIDTGIPMRDEHLQGSRWLNAEEHPDLVFVLEGAENIDRADMDAPEGVDVWNVELTGTMSFRGMTHDFRTDARITTMKESPVTQRRAPGDLLIIRSEFPIDLRKYGLNDPGMSAGKVAETVEVDVFLLMSTVSPDELRRR